MGRVASRAGHLPEMFPNIWLQNAMVNPKRGLKRDAYKQSPTLTRRFLKWPSARSLEMAVVGFTITFCDQ